MSDWEEIFGEGIGNLTLSRVDDVSDPDDLDMRLNQTFALLASSILRRWSDTDAWPNYEKDDIGTVFITSEHATALVVVDRGKAAIVLFSGLARRLLQFAALYFVGWHQDGEDDAQETYKEFLDGIWPSLADVWREHGLNESSWSFAHNMFLQMLEYVVQHELAHIDRGHIERQAGQDTRQYLSESEALSAHIAGDKAIRNREFEADVWAVQLHLEDLLEDADWSEQPQAVTFDYLRATVAAWMMVLMALDTDSSIAASRRSSHPAPVHRAMMVDEAFLDGIGNAFGFEWDDIREFLDGVWVNVSGVAERAKLAKGRWWGESTHKMGQVEFGKILEEFRAYFSNRPPPARLSDASIN